MTMMMLLLSGIRASPASPKACCELYIRACPAQSELLSRAMRTCPAQSELDLESFPRASFMRQRKTWNELQMQRNQEGITQRRRNEPD